MSNVEDAGLPARHGFAGTAKRLLFAPLLRLAFAEVAAAGVLRRFFMAVLPRSARKTVVVLANDGMGDNLYRIPFFAALRERYPANSFRMVAFVLPGMVPMFSRMPFFDEIRTDRRYTHKILFWPFAGCVRWALFHRADTWINLVRIRSVGYDFAMRLANPDFSCAYDTRLLALYFPGEAAFQRNRTDWAYTLLLQSVRPGDLADDYRRILGALSPDGRSTPLRDVDASFLADETFDTGSLGPEYAVFVPGAARTFRRWPVERFSEVAGILLAKHPRLRIAVVGSGEERKLGEAVASVSPDRVENLCGTTSLPQLGKILSGASFVLSNETGTAHYAAVLGVKTVCVLGGGDFGSYFPMPGRPHVKCVFRHEDCFGCRWSCTRSVFRDGLPAPCIESVSASAVLSAVAPAVRTC